MKSRVKPLGPRKVSQMANRIPLKKKETPPKGLVTDLRREEQELLKLAEELTSTRGGTFNEKLSRLESATVRHAAVKEEAIYSALPTTGGGEERVESLRLQWMVIETLLCAAAKAETRAQRTAATELLVKTFTTIFQDERPAIAKLPEKVLTGLGKKVGSIRTEVERMFGGDTLVHKG